MSLTISPLSLFVACLYLIVSYCSATACLVGRRHGQQFWHSGSWLLFAAVFLALAAARLFDIENTVRDNLRETLRSDGIYRSRREIQRPIAAGAIVLAAICAGWGLYRLTGTLRGRRNMAVMAALAGGAGMILLIAMRMVSLHPIDYLLYGPAKLNWLLDPGLSLLVAGSAIYYCRVVRSAG